MLLHPTHHIQCTTRKGWSPSTDSKTIKIATFHPLGSTSVKSSQADPPLSYTHHCNRKSIWGMLGWPRISFISSCYGSLELLGHKVVTRALVRIRSRRFDMVGCSCGRVHNPKYDLRRLGCCPVAIDASSIRDLVVSTRAQAMYCEALGEDRRDHFPLRMLGGGNRTGATTCLYRSYGAFLCLYDVPHTSAELPQLRGKAKITSVKGGSAKLAERFVSIFPDARALASTSLQRSHSLASRCR